MTPLFDAHTGFGGAEPGRRRAVSAGELAGEMHRLAIERALVRTAPEELDADFASSNEGLFGACEDLAQLVPCPVVAPPAGRDAVPEERQVASLIDRGAAAVCIRPKTDYWLLAEWASGRLLSALAARRLPVFCHENEVPPEQVAKLGGKYPQLPILHVPAGYRSLRALGALLEACGGVHLTLGGAWSLHRGIEYLVGRVGPQRLLFGTGFPAAECMAAVTMLMYADISDAERALIGSGNLQRLVGGIER